MSKLEKVDWGQVANSSRFVELASRKKRFLFGWWIVSTAWYFLLPLGAGFLPALFRWKVIGNINFAYLFALSQFFLSWAIAIHYYLWANKVSDPMTAQVAQQIERGEGLSPDRPTARMAPELEITGERA